MKAAWSNEAKWWWPFPRKVLVCDARTKTGKHGPHLCEEDAAHGYKHRCRCAFRWAA